LDVHAPAARSRLGAVTRFAGEGRLTPWQMIGGKSFVFPLAGASAAIAAIGAWFLSRAEADRLTWLPIAAASLVPAWWAWRAGLPRAIWALARGQRPTWRVELDEVGVRTSGGGDAVELDWWELRDYGLSELGFVLWMREPRNGANAVIVPRTFFPASEWPAIEALVKEKMPGATKAHADAIAAQAARRPRALWTLALWLLLIVGMYVVYQLVRPD
jgi:hypothetical protein